MQNHQSGAFAGQSVAYVKVDPVIAESFNQWAGTFDLELAEEARHPQDDVAGLVGDRVAYKDLAYKAGANGSYVDMPANIFKTSEDSSRWFNNSVSGTHKQFWTNPTN